MSNKRKSVAKHVWEHWKSHLNKSGEKLAHSFLAISQENWDKIFPDKVYEKKDTIDLLKLVMPIVRAALDYSIETEEKENKQLRIICIKKTPLDRILVHGRLFDHDVKIAREKASGIGDEVGAEIADRIAALNEPDRKLFYQFYRDYRRGARDSLYDKE